MVLPTIQVQLTAADDPVAYCAFSSMNVKSDWFRFGLPASRFDALLWKPTALLWQAMQLDVARGTAGESRRAAMLSAVLSAVLVRLAVCLQRRICEVCRRRRAGHVGLLDEIGPGVPEARILRVQRRAANPNALGHCVLSSM